MQLPIVALQETGLGEVAWETLPRPDERPRQGGRGGETGVFWLSE